MNLYEYVAASEDEAETFEDVVQAESLGDATEIVLADLDHPYTHIMRIEEIKANYIGLEQMAELMRAHVLDYDIVSHPDGTRHIVCLNEECDQHYSKFMSAEDLRALAKEIEKLADTVDELNHVAHTPKSDTVKGMAEEMGYVVIDHKVSDPTQ